MCSPSYAEWFTAIGTLLLAVIAIFQEPLRRWRNRPRFMVTAKSAPPFCMSVPEYLPAASNGISFLPTNPIRAVYLRILIANVGKSTATNAEVYAQKLERQRVDETWEAIDSFPPMNLVWSDIGQMYLAKIVPQMSKYCDLASTYQPDALAMRGHTKEGLDPKKTSLTFRLITSPNHKGHVVGPGEYKLHILVAAENCSPASYVVKLKLSGSWYDEQEIMLRDGVGISID
jgi:hypothetical protein